MLCYVTCDARNSVPQRFYLERHTHAASHSAVVPHSLLSLHHAVSGYIKLALPAGKANPAPPVGPALGAKGVNIMQFCKEYNAATQDKIGTIIPVEITVYEVGNDANWPECAFNAAQVLSSPGGAVAATQFADMLFLTFVHLYRIAASRSF